jgi:hypothetical protein
MPAARQVVSRRVGFGPFDTAAPSIMTVRSSQSSWSALGYFPKEGWMPGSLLESAALQRVKPIAYRRSVTGIVASPIMAMWNIEKHTA